MKQKRILPYAVTGGVYLLTSIFGTGCTSTQNLDVTGKQLRCNPAHSEVLPIAKEMYGDAVIGLDFGDDLKHIEENPELYCDLRVTRDSIGNILNADYSISDKNAFPGAVNALLHPIIDPDYVAPTQTIDEVTVEQVEEKKNSVISRDVNYPVRSMDTLWDLYTNSCFSDALQDVYLDFDMFKSNMEVVGGAGKDGELMAGQTLKFSVPEDFSLESCLN